jgi:hypothetical protein
MVVAVVEAVDVVAVVNHQTLAELISTRLQMQ